MAQPQSETKDALAARFRIVIVELHELERIIKSKQLDPDLLADFRAALDHIRLTAFGINRRPR